MFRFDTTGDNVKHAALLLSSINFISKSAETFSALMNGALQIEAPCLCSHVGLENKLLFTQNSRHMSLNSGLIRAKR